jgi:hypothetical protein
MAKAKLPRAQRKDQKRKLELSKRALAHSTPLFNPRDPWAPRLKVGGVPVSTLDDKEHHARHSRPRWW